METWVSLSQIPVDSGTVAVLDGGVSVHAFLCLLALTSVFHRQGPLDAFQDAECSAADVLVSAQLIRNSLRSYHHFK